MRSFFPLIFAAVAILILGLIEIVLLRYLNRRWWQKKLIRRLAWSLPLVGIFGLTLWVFGEYRAASYISYPGLILSVLSFVLELSLMLSLPVSGLMHLLSSLIEKITAKRSRSQAETTDHGRRDFLRIAAAALPMVTIGSGVTGIARSFEPVRLFELPLYFSNLPEGLDGFRILHLSDLHLRHYVTLDDLSDLLERAEKFRPDLVVVTGDVADDLRQLPEALKMIAQLKAKFGFFASLGNHEYFRGILKVRRIFDKSPVPLLVNNSSRIRVGKGTLLVEGIDDPVTIGAKNHRFFVRTIDEASGDLRSGEFSLLMSHRPDALDHAAVRRLDLVLAGHTHGGQMGYGGRSLFESTWPDRYLWGHYRIGDTHLYTSSGIGHWFPFRLGCPAEAPLIILHSEETLSPYERTDIAKNTDVKKV